MSAIQTLNTRSVLNLIAEHVDTAAEIGDRLCYATHTVQVMLDVLEREGIVMRREEEYRLNPFFQEDSRRWAVER